MPTFSKRRINVWIREVAKKYNFKVGEIAYIFCSDEKILEINQEYLEHDYYTDIITFDYTEKKVISGDPIYVHTWEENQRHVRMSIAAQESCFHHYKSIRGDYDFSTSVLHS